MAARTKKKPRAKAKARSDKSADGIEKTVNSSDTTRDRTRDRTSQKQSLPKISADLINEDEMTEEEEMAAIMKLSEISLRKFLEDEPDIYTLEDLKVRYK